MKKVSDIELNKAEIKMLRQIKWHKHGVKASVLNRGSAKSLLCDGLLYFDEYQGNEADGVYTIRQEGLDWLEFNRKSNKRFWIPIAISTAALIKSFWPEIISGMQQLAQLLK